MVNVWGGECLGGERLTIDNSDNYDNLDHRDDPGDVDIGQDYGDKGNWATKKEYNFDDLIDHYHDN